ncbi:hypothetical protein Tco_1239477, partial [Tanacetum coccineum]
MAQLKEELVTPPKSDGSGTVTIGVQRHSTTI